MKKLSLALALLGLSSTAAFAGGIDYQEPEESGVFMIGVEAIYARAGSSDFVYGLQSVTNNSNIDSRSLTIDPDYQYGYHIDLGYAMPGDGADITLGYTNYSSDDTERKSNVIGNTFISLDPDTVLNPLGGVDGFASGNSGAGAVSAKTEYDYFDVDLLLGKEFVLQNRYHFHPFVGVRYASIESKDKAYYYSNNSFVGFGSISNEFTGVGPRAGVDGAMEIANGFSFVARAAGSLLIGDFDYKYQTQNPNGVAGAQESFSVRNSDEHFTVPEADYRLALNYTHEFSPETSFGLELGWQAVHYYDVMDKGASRFQTTVGGNGDWGFQGPYLRVQANIA